MEINIRDKKLWLGVNTNSVFWLDVGKRFSIDVGRWFIRLFLKVGEVHFCKYLGIISKALR